MNYLVNIKQSDKISEIKKILQEEYAYCQIEASKLVASKLKEIIYIVKQAPRVTALAIVQKLIPSLFDKETLNQFIRYYGAKKKIYVERKGYVLEKVYPLDMIVK